MKKLLFTLLIFFATNTTYTVVAQEKNNQPKHKNWERIDALRIEFVLKKLALSQSNESKFIPVYKVYQQEMRNIYIQRRQSREQNKNNPEAQVNKDFYFESKLLETRKVYKNKFQEILTPEQVKVLYAAEREFKEVLLKQLKSN